MNFEVEPVHMRRRYNQLKNICSYLECVNNSDVNLRTLTLSGLVIYGSARPFLKISVVGAKIPSERCNLLNT